MDPYSPLTPSAARRTNVFAWIIILLAGKASIIYGITAKDHGTVLIGIMLIFLAVAGACYLDIGRTLAKRKGS